VYQTKPMAIRASPHTRMASQLTLSICWIILSFSCRLWNVCSITYRIVTFRFMSRGVGQLNKSVNSRRTPRWLSEGLPPAVIVMLALLAWQGIATGSGLPPFILPSPWRVVGAAVATRDLLGDSIATTMLETLLGLAISLVLGVILAAAMDLSSFLRRGLYPILVASQTVQILAIAPLLIIWFGFGLLPKVIVVVLVCFFPLAISTADGLASSDPDLIALLRAMGATRGQIWRMVRLPAALPSFFSGLRIAVTYSVVGATIGEWVGGTAGLGLYMLRSKNALATDQVFVAIVITSLLSIGLFVLVYAIERLSLPWYYSAQRREQWDEAGIF
jgi:ABC-type nitrate/sulfonate/bicarbonate transport system permease component